MLRLRVLVLLSIVAAALLLFPSAALATVEVSITADGIEPDPVTAGIDEPIVFTNDTDTDVRLVDDAGRWDSGDLQPGGTFTITFSGVITSTFTSPDGAITGTIEIVSGDTPATGGEASEATEAPDDEPEPTPQATEEVTEEPAPDGLADTGAPAAALAGLVGLSLLAGGALVARTRRD